MKARHSYAHIEARLADLAKRGDIATNWRIPKSCDACGKVTKSLLAVLLTDKSLHCLCGWCYSRLDAEIYNVAYEQAKALA
jgi:hypothetical protein